MIALIGFMGAGKSTLAKALGQKMRLSVYNIDNMVYEIAGTSNMNEVFAKGGEEYLRSCELAAVESLADKPDGIIDCGAGLITYQPSLDKLSALSKQIIFLEASFDLSKDRVGDDKNRPLFTDPSEAEKRYHIRLPLYRRVATDVLPVHGQSVDDLVMEVMDIVYED